MSTAAKRTLEQRVATLEEELTQLKARLLGPRNAMTRLEKDWRKIVGTFANDPIYAEAMRLGRRYRESLRPTRKQSKRPSRRKD